MRIDSCVRSRLTTCLLTALSALSIGAPRLAAAQDATETCMSAAESAQTLRRDAKLVEAKQKLMICARASCPRVVRDDCTRWLAQVDESTPTIVVRARDASGRDVTDVRVLVDGKLVTEGLDGRATPIDPGPHVVRVERGAEWFDERVVVTESQKGRLLEATLRAPTAPPEPPRAAQPQPPEGVAPPSHEAPDASRPVPTATWIFGGVGLAALGATAYFFGEAAWINGTLNAIGCAPHCAQSDGDAVRRFVVLGYASLGVGVASLGAATIFYLARPTAHAPAVGVVAAPTGDGAWLGATGRF